jgi:glutathione S-transferase
MDGGGDYRSVNPLGYVPALQLDNGTVLTEGVAISQYAADLVPAKGLVPPNGTLDRTRLQGWLNFMSSEMHKGGLSPLFYAGMPEQAKDIFRRRLAARFAHLDAHLATSAYLLGSRYSIADAHLFVVSNWTAWVDVDLSPYANLVAFRQRVGARAAVRSALAAEGLDPWPRSRP